MRACAGGSPRRGVGGVAVRPDVTTRRPAPPARAPAIRTSGGRQRGGARARRVGWLLPSGAGRSLARAAGRLAGVPKRRAAVLSMRLCTLRSGIITGRMNVGCTLQGDGELWRQSLWVTLEGKQHESECV
ncbi:hypothetical protein chiPu_0014424 [Chiloscyllium punctatum]|uniref:Uncharacterized protein n=1 Tax=Chiloscyllium punctatum TaxID=137246 RepID=A0A401SZW1_CHIPU|nr:hypothetical protein [Chiloscyllium punctatum]